MPWSGAEGYEQRLLTAATPRTLVPVSDDAAWRQSPRHRWLYDRLQLSLEQQLYCAPCGVDPERWPVIIKPIINLTGMSQGVRVVTQPHSLDKFAGFFWSEVLPEPHFSVDLLVNRNVVCWLAATRCYECRPGVFRGFEVGVELPGPLREVIVGFVDSYLPKYVGALNVELRDGVVLECHLRPALQWLDLYGPEFVRSWAKLADDGVYEPCPSARRGWSIPVYDRWDKKVTVRATVTTVCTAFDPWQPPGVHRTGYVNGHERDEVLAVARALGTSYL